MNGIHFKFVCLFVVVLLMPYFVLAEDNEDKTHHYNDDEEMLRSEHRINSHDVSNAEDVQPARRHLRQSLIPNFDRNMDGNDGIQLAQGHIQAAFKRQPQDAQLASSSNKVVLVLNNDKNKFAESAKSAEEPLKRLTRNPDAIEDFLGKFHQVGGEITEQLLGQVSQSAPNISESIGQFLTEALMVLPNSFNLSQPTQSSVQANQPGAIDYAQLAQSLSQSLREGAAKNLFNPNGANQPGGIDNAQLGQSLSQSLREGAANLFNPNGANQPGGIDYAQLGQSLSQSLREAAANLFNPNGANQPGGIDYAQLGQSLSQSLREAAANLFNPNGANQPGGIDNAQLGQSLHQSLREGAAKNLFNPNGANQPGGIDFAQLGQSIRQSLGEGATQHLLNQNRAQATPAPEVDANIVGAAASEDEAPKNSFEQLLGSPALFNIPPLLPFGMFGSLPRGCLLSAGSEISEVRVLPDKNSPYNISPKEVDHKTIGEMKLKAILKQALNEKTIPILWFHLPPNSELQKSAEDLEMEAKLKTFEQQVIAELKQLQDLSKIANEIKKAQLQSGAQPTPSLTTKLRLFEIPINDITLGDIETTLKDEHFKMLMQTLVKQSQNVGFHRHQQATTKYLTDLTGTPIKRQTKTAEDVLKTMEKDDMLKMMTYAYRMAALNGHEMPWLRQRITTLGEKEILQTTTTKNDQQPQLTDANMRMTAERQWLENKHQQMTIEAARQQRQQALQNQMLQMVATIMRQRQMPEQRQMSQIVDPTMRQQQMPEQREMMPPQITLQRPQEATQNQMAQMVDTTMRQQQMSEQRQMGPQQMTLQRQQEAMQNQMAQMVDPNMRQQQIPEQRQMMPQQITLQRQQEAMQNQMAQMVDSNLKQQQIPEQRQMMPPQMQQVMQMQMPQMVDTTMRQQQMPEQRQMMPPQMQQQMPLQRQMQQSQMFDPSMQMTQQPMMADFNMQQEMPMQRQWSEPNLQQNQRQLVDTKTPEMKSNTNEKPEQRQSVESKMPEQLNTEWEKADRLTEPRQQIDANMGNMPIVGEAKPQMAENDDKARHIGSGKVDLFDVLDIFGGGGKSKGKGGDQPTIINYYYTTDGKHHSPVYAPAGSYQTTPQKYGHTGGYGAGHEHAYPHAHGNAYPHAHEHVHPHAHEHAYPHAHSHTPHYHSPAGQYGSGAHGPNAYGSNTYGGYRTAIGDEEIVAMLQQQQQQQPKMMMMMTLNDEETMPTTETKNEMKQNAEHLIENHSKRLAKRQTNSYTNAAAYLVVLRNENNNNDKSSRSRRKRSTKYTTLEPIDENSLNALRKTYKNSLKEITLNPNETPDEALMRYNAEAIREALEKANKQPMEILAGGEDEEVKDNNTTSVMEKQQNQQQVNKPLPESVVRQQTQTQSLSDAYYDPGSNQQDLYNNLVSKYNTPEISSRNNKAENSFLSMYDVVETAPYITDYSVTTQPYYLTNNYVRKNVPRASKSVVQPQFSYNDMLSSPRLPFPSNAINKKPQRFLTSDLMPYGHFVRELPPTNTHYTVSHVVNKNDYIDAYSPIGQPQAELTNRYRPTRVQESPSFDILMAVIQKQLDQCCNQCKHNILKSLDETFKHRYDGGGNKLPVSDINLKPYSNDLNRPHIVTNRNPKKEDIEYKQWLTKMSEKGYNKAHLTKQHQSQYLKNGKPNLHVETEQNNGHDVEKVFFRNNQTYKRETAKPKREEDSGNETEEVTASIEKENKIAKLEEEKGDKEEQEDEARSEEVKAETETKKPIANEAMHKKPPTKSEKNIKIELIKHQNVTNEKENIKNKNTTKPTETDETTTHSVYALRGQFRTHKENPKVITLNTQGKQFDNYKNVNKLGSANIIAKANLTDKENLADKTDQLEEQRDIMILHDISQHSKEKIKESSIEVSTITATSSSYVTTTPSPTSRTTTPVAIPTFILKIRTTSNATNTEENSKKLSRRRTGLSSKNQKTIKSSPKLEITK